MSDVREMIDQAVSLGKEQRLAEAEELLRRAVSADPSSCRAHYNLGVALQHQDRPEEAAEAFRRAIELDSAQADAHVGLSTTLQRLNRVTDAIASARRALELEPDNAETHGVLSRQLLLAGEFKRGWNEYEWRWKCASFADACSLRRFVKPRWNGSAPKGKTILLHHEQGFGDTIQFVRYAPLVASRGARVIVRVPRELLRVIRRLQGVDDVIATDGPLPEFDVHAPLMSLPMLLNTTLKTIPAEVPYLFSHRGLMESWAKRMAEDGARLRVGLAWAGRATHPDDKRRSIPPEVFGPLGDVEGVAFYSLQKRGAEGPAAQAPPERLRVVDAARELNDFADAAALLENLDLLITADTAVAHLAGAMGKPVWLLLAFCPDFRWMLERDDTPWYPTMRLFRQTTRGDWGDVVARVASELRTLIGKTIEPRSHEVTKK